MPIQKSGSSSERLGSEPASVPGELQTLWDFPVVASAIQKGKRVRLLDQNILQYVAPARLAHERDRSSIRGPDWVAIIVGGWREIQQRLAGRREDTHETVVTAIGYKRQTRTIRRPRGSCIMPAIKEEPLGFAGCLVLQLRRPNLPIFHIGQLPLHRQHGSIALGDGNRRAAESVTETDQMLTFSSDGLFAGFGASLPSACQLAS